MRTSNRPLVLACLAMIPAAIACTTTSATPSDAGPQAEASADGSTPSDAAPSDAAPTDATQDTGAVACASALTDNVDFDTAPIATWCVGSNGGGSKSTRACDGYLSIILGVGVDCDTQYIFDATTKKLVAVLDDCNGTLTTCRKGPSSFVLPGAHCTYNGDWGSQAISCPQDAGADAQSD